MSKTWTGLLVIAALSAGTPAIALDPAAMQPIGDVQSWEKDSRGLLLHCSDHSTVRVSVLSSDLVRVRAAFKKPLRERDSWAVARQQWPTVLFQAQEAGSDVRLTTARLQVVVHKSPLRIEFCDEKGAVINADAAPMACDTAGHLNGELYDAKSGPAVSVRKSFDFDEHFYGLGEKASRLDKRRGLFTMWNSDTAFYHENQDPLYQSIPFYVGLTGEGVAYGLFYDNSYRSVFDMGHTSQESVSWTAEGGDVDYYFFYGPAISTVVQRYTELTGRMPMPPRWALGHQASRYSYYPDSMVERVARTYRQHALPLDAIHLDIDYMQDYRVFTWNRKRFPDPDRMTGDLSRMGVHTIVIVDPGVKNDPGGHYPVYDQGVAGDYFVKRPDGQPLLARVWPGESRFVDFTREDARRWWGDLMRAYTDHGVDGIWDDMNEPADFTDRKDANLRDSVFDDHGEHTRMAKNHNVFGFLMGRAAYEGMARLRPHERPFVITRAGYAGQQRYTAMWTGDTRSSWEELFLTIPMYQNLGLSGETFVGSDIGGYGGPCDGEFLVRSYQLAFLVPFCRNHRQIDGYDQEPWRFGPYYEGIIRDYLDLRYRLMPYLYAGIEEAHRTGVPLLRATLLYDQSDPQLLNLDDQLMVGSDLLLAPVVQSGLEHRRVYLPRGQWYDFYTGERFEGGRFILCATPLERVPLFVRAGAILPLAPSGCQKVDDTEKGPLTLRVYPDARGRASGSLYEDDGHTSDGASARRELRYDGNLQVGEWQGAYKVPQRRYVVEVVGRQPSKPQA